MAVAPEGGGNPDQEARPNGVGPHPDGVDSELEESPQPQDAHSQLIQGDSSSSAATDHDAQEAELSVAVGVAKGQMENILQEATKEEAGAEVRRVIHAGVTGAEEDQGVSANGTEAPEVFANGLHQENSVPKAEEEGEPPDAPAQTAEELQHQEEEMEKQVVESCCEPEQPAAPRTLTNGFTDSSPEPPSGDQVTCTDSEQDRVLSESVEQAEKRASLMESSTETLTEEACSRVEPPAPPALPAPPGPPAAFQNRQPHGDRTQLTCSRKEKVLEAADPSSVRTLNGGGQRAPFAACLSADLSRDGVCNSDSSDGEPCGGSHWAKGGGERAPLSRQVSLASCNSLIHHRGSCSQHRWCHAALGRAAVSPEQPSRSHLDDDGLMLHTDAIQQRLRQIEAGHQMEVEMLKKQLQELWSRLENQQHAGCHRVNGDMGDEVVRSGTMLMCVRYAFADDP